jgi:hypothetical protein
VGWLTRRVGDRKPAAGTWGPVVTTSAKLMGLEGCRDPALAPSRLSIVSAAAARPGDVKACIPPLTKIAAAAGQAWKKTASEND